nr:venom peptide Htgkr11 [Hadogenes troglodytes]
MKPSHCFILVLVLLLSLLSTASSESRNPPLNGSMFGKRSYTQVEGSEEARAMKCQAYLERCLKLMPAACV